MTTNKIVLGFIGDLAAGKGTACRYLKEKYNTNSYRFSTMLRDILDRIYIEKKRDNLQKLSAALRGNFGQDIMSRVIAEDVVHDSSEITAVDGIRRPSDIVNLEQLSGFYLIYLTANPIIRWQRLVKRNENLGDDKKSYEEFLRDEQAEADRLIKELGQKARFTVVNDGTFEEFYQQIENVLGKVQQLRK